MGNACESCINSTSECVSMCSNKKLKVTRKENKLEEENKEKKIILYPLIIVSGLISDYKGVIEFFANNTETFKKIDVEKFSQDDEKELVDLSRYEYHYSYEVSSSKNAFSFSGAEKYETIGIKKSTLRECYEESKYPLLYFTENVLTETLKINPETVSIDKIIKQFLANVSFKSESKESCAIFYFLPKALNCIKVQTTNEQRFLDQMMASPNFHVLDDTECINSDLLGTTTLEDLKQIEDAAILYKISDSIGLEMFMQDECEIVTPTTTGPKNNSIEEFEIVSNKLPK